MKHDIQAVRPARGQVVHLYLKGYQPAAKGRSCRDSSALCGASVGPHSPPPAPAFIPLAEALKWTSLQPSELDPRPVWKWCRPCIGHAVEVTGMAAWVLHHVSRGGAL